MTAASVTRGPTSLRPCCPRCGYDLQGTVSAWIASCPIDGTCTECGLGFAWRHVVGAQAPPRWFIEQPHTRRFDWLPRVLATLAQSLRPWRFWSSVQMHHPVRRGAIALYLGFLGAMSLAAWLLSNTVVALGTLRAWRPSVGRGARVRIGWDDVLSMMTFPARHWSASHWALVMLGVVLVAVVHLGCAAGFLALPVSRRQAKVRWAHIGRIVAHGAALFVPLLWGALLGRALEPFAPLSLGELIASTCAAVLTWGLVPMEIAWWSIATGRYLRMPHAWGVGAAVVMMSALAAALATTVAWLLLSPLL